MYFLSENDDLRRGAVVVIQPVECEIGETASPDLPVPCYCSGASPDSHDCSELKLLVVGQVTRSAPLKESGGSRFGIGVKYL
jgi:hypothetical protein